MTGRGKRTGKRNEEIARQAVRMNGMNKKIGEEEPGWGIEGG